MGKIEYHLDRIATALENIAKGLNAQTSVIKPSVKESDEKPLKLESNFIFHQNKTLEEDLFIRTTKIYLDETKRKFEEGLQRKSAVKVSQNLIPMQISFLKENLPSFNIVEHSSAILVISKNETPKALVRIYTDLGFHRADNWRKDILQITKVASSLNISTDNIFLIVISNLNGLDSTNVSSTLGFKISNKDILDKQNQNILKDYCERYISSFANILPTPKNQIYFLAGALHPNVVAEEIFSNNNHITDLENYNWMSTPLAKITYNIKSL